MTAEQMTSQEEALPRLDAYFWAVAFIWAGLVFGAEALGQVMMYPDSHAPGADPEEALVSRTNWRELGPPEFESGIPQVSPKNGPHSQLMGLAKSLGDLLDLTVAVLRAVIDRCPNSYRTHIKGLLDTGKKDLVMFIGIGQEFIVVDLDDKRDFMGVFPGDSSQDPERGGNGIAPSGYCQLNDVFRIKIDGIRGKGSSGCMFDALIHSQYGKISGP